MVRTYLVMDVLCVIGEVLRASMALHCNIAEAGIWYTDVERNAQGSKVIRVEGR